MIEDNVLRIVIDTDVISHFIIAQEVRNLDKIFDYPIVLLSIVHDELARSPKRERLINHLIEENVFTLVDFPEDNFDIKKEFAFINSRMFKGKGESACLAYARFTSNILASSNLSDVKDYCIEHDIRNLTTMDFLCHALSTGKWTEERCDEFITKVLTAKSKLPVTKMSAYKCPENH